MAHIPRFLKRINSTLFVKATAEQLFLVNLDIEKKKLEKLRRIPKQKAFHTQSDRAIELPKPDINHPETNKKNILGSLLLGIIRPPPVLNSNSRKGDGSEEVASPVEVNIDAEQAEKRADILENLDMPKLDLKKAESKIINMHSRSKKCSNLSFRDQEIEDARSVHSEYGLVIAGRGSIEIFRSRSPVTRERIQPTISVSFALRDLPTQCSCHVAMVAFVMSAQ